MSDIEDKLETLFIHLIGRVVEEAFIEDDAFVLYFDDGSMIELYSSDGDLDLYFELNQGQPQLH